MILMWTVKEPTRAFILKREKSIARLHRTSPVARESTELRHDVWERYPKLKISIENQTGIAEIFLGQVKHLALATFAFELYSVSIGQSLPPVCFGRRKPFYQYPDVPNLGKPLPGVEPRKTSKTT